LALFSEVLMRTLATLFTRAAPSSMTVCETCAEACTPACRAAAFADRQRTAVLSRGFPR
jgi:hypothetical protein